MNVFKLEFKSNLKGLLLWVGILSLVLVLFMSLFPTMGTDAMKDLVQTKLNALPQDVLEAVGLDEIPDFTKILDYFSYIFQYIAVAGGIYAALLGAQALVKEENDGTIEYLYAQPVTRTQIIFQKLLAAAAVYGVLNVGLSIVCGILFAVLKPEDTELVALMTDFKSLLAGTMVGGLVFLCLGLLISVLLKSSRQAIAAAVGLVFVTYILGIFSKAFADYADWVGYLVYLSPLDYATPFDVLLHGFNALRILIGFIIMAVSVTLAFYFYRRKDLKT